MGKTPDKTKEKNSAFAPPASQEALDALIQERVDEELAKFSDYDDLKERAGKVDGLESQVAELETANTELTGTVDQFKQDKARADVAADVAKDKGVPAEALRGNTKEELEAHADQLKEFVKPAAPVVPGQAQTPGKPPVDPMREFTNNLFNNAKAE